MDTKRLRALAETVMNSEARWRMDALSLARAVLAEVPEASQVEEAPWVAPLREVQDGMADALLGSERDVIAYVDKRVADLEARLDMEQQQRAEGRCRDERARKGLDGVHDALNRITERLAKLEEARLDRPEPGEPDPLESAKAHVSSWPDWKVKAAREQLPTQDMHGQPMPSHVATPAAPAGFEVVSEPWVYARTVFGPSALILSADGFVRTLTGEGRRLMEGEHWLAPIGRPRP